MKYKVGQLVKLKEDIIAGRKYDGITLYPGMVSIFKEPSIINSISKDCNGIAYYTTKGTGIYGYTKEMLKPAPLYKVGDKVLIKDLLEACEDDYSFGIVDEMRDLSNKICTIESVNLDLQLRGIRYSSRLATILFILTTMKYLDKYPDCKGCPVIKYCGTMVGSIRLCNSYQEPEQKEQEQTSPIA